MGLSIFPNLTNQVQLRATLTSSGTFTLGSQTSPQLVYVVCVGGGGSGGSGAGGYNDTATYAGCGSGANGGYAGAVTFGSYLMTGSISYTVGAGGAGPAGGASLTTGNNGNAGGTTIFGSVIAIGGYGGLRGNQVGNLSNPDPSIPVGNGIGGQSASYFIPTSTIYYPALGSWITPGAIDTNQSVYYPTLKYTGAAGGVGGGAGRNAASAGGAGTGGAGGTGGTISALGTTSGSGTGWTTTNYTGISPFWYGAITDITTIFAGTGGGGAGGSSASGSIAAGAAGGVQTNLFGGTGGAGAAGATTTGAGQANGNAGSNATGYGAGGGGGSGYANGNTKQASTSTSTGGAGGSGSQGVIYIYY